MSPRPFPADLLSAPWLYALRLLYATFYHQPVPKDRLRGSCPAYCFPRYHICPSVHHHPDRDATKCSCRPSELAGLEYSFGLSACFALRASWSLTTISYNNISIIKLNHLTM